MAKPKPIMIGDRFSRLIVIARAPNGGIHRKFECRCDCGTVKIVFGTHLRSGLTRSCGCLAKELNMTHGHTIGVQAGGPRSLTYNSWNAMKARCDNPRVKEYPQYGGRGIVICDRWRRFENFIADMGERPPNTSLDRINVNGNYDPGNCRWAAASVQLNNKRNSNRLTAHGITRTMSEWAKLLGVSKSTLYNRQLRGWSAQRIIEQPIQKQVHF